MQSKNYKKFAFQDKFGKIIIYLENNNKIAITSIYLNYILVQKKYCDPTGMEPLTLDLPLLINQQE